VVASIAPETRGHGVPEVIEALLLKAGRIRSRVALVKVIVSSITIGSGGSAGREGPIAQIGASVGSLLGRLARLEPHDVRLLVACGLSAGIAGTFNAPLGGALFGAEVLLRDIGVFDAIPLVFSSVVGAATASVFLGQKPSFTIPYTPTWSPGEIPLYLLHGGVMGLLAVAWVRLFYAVENVFDKIPVKPHLKPALGGLATGLLIAAMPGYGVEGVGYEGVEAALAGLLAPTLMLALGVSKILATSFTIGSGGSGGVFAPSLYIGSMLGGVLGHLYARIFDGVIHVDPLGYQLAGMAALFAGAAQAPLNAIVMIPEMSRSYSLIPPLMASAGASFVVSWLLMKGGSIYTLKLERRGVKVRVLSSYILDLVRVGDVMTRNVYTIPADAPLPLVETLFEENPYGGYPLVDKRTGRLVGVITRSDLERAKRAFTPDDYSKARAVDAASRDPVTVTPDNTVREAYVLMKKYGISRLPVVDSRGEGRVVGIITMRDVLRAYDKALEEWEA
jgi:CIC family chloride channel protein